jgi:hypothetical protein
MSQLRTHLIRLGAVALAAGATVGAATAVVGVAGTGAGAATPATSSPTTLSGIKTQAATDITDRVNDLNAAIAKVNAAKGLGSSQTTLVSHLSADIAPLQQLNQTIQGDTTVRQAAHDFGTIFSDYRVYVLVLPASRIAGTADHATTTAIPVLTADAAKAQAHVTPANQATLQPLVDDLNSQIGDATNASNGLASTVLAFTPAQWDANHSLLAATTSSSRAVTAALQKGRADVQQIAQDLEAAHAHVHAGAGGSDVTTTS